MYIEGKVVDRDDSKDPKEGLPSVKIIAQSPTTRREINSVYTDHKGEFSLVLPESAFAKDEGDNDKDKNKAKDKEFTIYLTATNWDYYPAGITLYATRRKGRLVREYPAGGERLTIELKKWKKRLSRKVRAWGTLCAIAALLVISALLYYQYVLSPYAAGVSSQAAQPSVEVQQAVRYWYGVVFWSFFGACLGLLWSLQRTILDRNFDSDHWPRYLFRLLGSPFMAVAFIFLVSFVGFSGQTFAGVPTAQATTEINVMLACSIAFLGGMFIERLYQRLRSMAEWVFKSDYKA